MGDMFTFAHISSSASEPTKPFSHQQEADCEAGKPIYLVCLPASLPCLLALCGSFTGFTALWGKKRLVVELLLCPEKLELFLVACPAHAEVEQFALSILDSCNCARTLEGKGSKKIPILFVFV